MTYIVYEVKTRKNLTSYRQTKKRCQTQEEAEQEQRRLMEETGRFHEIRKEEKA